jgi:hypothetical protein
VKLANGWESNGLYEEGFSLEFIGRFLIFCAVIVISAFAFQLFYGIFIVTKEFSLEQIRLDLLPTISAKFAALPRQDPPEGPDFYALANPVFGALDAKLQGMHKLRDEVRIYISIQP